MRISSNTTTAPDRRSVSTLARFASSTSTVPEENHRWAGRVTKCKKRPEVSIGRDDYSPLCVRTIKDVRV